VATPDPIAGAKYISLETYRKSGVPVRTTVLVVEDKGLYFVRTDPGSGKVKRIRGNPRVRMAPSTFGGKVEGGWIEGQASIVTGDEAERVQGLFRAKYGLRIPLLKVWHSITRMPRHAIIAIRPA
jgi:uncharacterized protein